jgi:hypothetical protein
VGLPIRDILNGTFEQQLDCWYDWFCTDKALVNKTKTLIGLLHQIALSPRIDIYKQYVWFKNNCPMYGDAKLYDDFRISDMGGDTQYVVVPRNPHGKACVYARESGPGWASDPVVEGTWDDVVAYFNTVE